MASKIVSTTNGTTATGAAMIGVRESLLDEISILTPTDAFFYNAIGNGTKPKAVKHEFLTDSIRAAASNAAVEGATPTVAASTQPTRIFNYCQIQEESYAVSSTANAVTTAGRASEREYQRLKHMKGLVRDMEYAYLQEVIVAPAGDSVSGTAAKMKGALNWTITNLDKAADATLEAAGTITGGTARDLTADIVKNVMSDIYSNGGGGKTLTAYMNVFQQSMFDSFAGGTNLRRAVNKGNIDDFVDVYVTAFGTVQAKIHRDMPTDVVFIADHEYWKKATLEAINEVELSKTTGLATTYHITVNHTLEARNELASGRIVNLTTA